eukprot:scaffold7074_cov256-Pinguiococcus_pyrenoidosus.AAC.16
MPVLATALDPEGFADKSSSTVGCARFHRVAVESERSFVPDEALVDAASLVEDSLRRGLKVFFYSRLGHGRVGVLGAALLGNQDASSRLSQPFPAFPCGP